MASSQSNAVANIRTIAVAAVTYGLQIGEDFEAGRRINQWIPSSAAIAIEMNAGKQYVFILGNFSVVHRVSQVGEHDQHKNQKPCDPALNALANPATAKNSDKGSHAKPNSRKAIRQNSTNCTPICRG